MTAPSVRSHQTPTASSAALAATYAPLPVRIRAAEGAWMTDDSGTRLLDMLSGYSALNFGHRHPDLIDAAHHQLDELTLTSRAFGSVQLDAFAEELAEFCGKDLVIPMNTGAEAVETAIKTARKWGYLVKDVPADQATIVVAHNNFHGRTTTIISFSDDPAARQDFGPYAPGFRAVAFGDIDALRDAIDDSTVAVLIEPIQGEAGVIIPAAGYLRDVRRLCTEQNVLFMADEIQSGLGRTGATFGCDREGVVPDVYILGKALGGGIVPLSAVVADREVLGVFRPGEHGSTFGGNPLACAVGRAVLALLRTGEYQQRAAQLGELLRQRLAALPPERVSDVRVVGLWAGIDLVGRSGRNLCEGLMARRVLARDTHGSTVRLSPPLVIEREDLEWGLKQIEDEVRSG